MNLFAIPPLISFLSVLTIGFLVFVYNMRSKTHVTFGLLCFSAAWWLFGFSMMYLSEQAGPALAWARIGLLGIIFIPVFAYHFIAEFCQFGWAKRTIILVYILAVPALVFSRSQFLYAGVARHYYGFYPYAGSGYLFFLLMFAVLFGLGLVLLIVKMISNQDKSHAQQIRYVFLAFLFGATGIVDYLVKYPIEIYPFGYISAFLLIATVAYAIRKHHLLDIEIFIKRGAVYSILTALLTGIFVSIILVWERFFIGATGYGSIWIGIIVAFVISVLFQPLRESVQEIVDRTFFRARYDYQRILNRYSRALTQPMADLSRFSRIAPYLLTKSLRLAGASFLVLDRENRQIVVRAGERGAAETEGVVLSDDSPLINELRRRKKELSLEEVKARIKAGEETDKYRSISDEMAGLKIVLAIPSITDSEYFGQPTLIAVLCLGPKLSDEGYSAEDINFLDTLANQATISIEYAFILEELKRNQERVLRSEKLAVIGTTTAGVAHELKNPLTYLSAVAQVLPLKWDDPKFRESVVQMFPSEVQRMQLIIEGLLDYSRSRELSMKPLDIKSVTDKALALLAYEIKKKKVYIKTDYQHARQVNGDPNRLMQVFMNLMANAVQAMGDKGGDLKISTEDADGEVRVNICDTGPGIAADQLRKIFDPFFSTKEAGTGLGLPISKKIVDEHHGSIYVDSKVGEGTTFTVCLPIAA